MPATARHRYEQVAPLRGLRVLSLAVGDNFAAVSTGPVQLPTPAVLTAADGAGNDSGEVATAAPLLAACDANDQQSQQQQGASAAMEQ
jgi:hypothetical protein